MTPHTHTTPAPSLDAILAAETALSGIRSLVTEALREVGIAKRALLAMPSAEPGEATAPVSLADAIIEALEREGPLSFKALYGALPTFTWNQVYREVKRPNGLIERGLVLHTSSGADRGLVSLAPGVTASGLVDPYLQDILDRDHTLDADSAFAKDAAAVMREYTERVIRPRNNGRLLKAYHLLGSIKNHGMIKTVANVTGGRNPTPGFLDCIAAGIPEATMETLVVKHPELFSADLHARVVQRLADAAESSPKTKA